MEPLYERSGRVYAWINRQRGHIISLHGHHIAFVEGDSVYNWRGQHIGWWEGDHVRNHQGQVAVFLRGASGLGVGVPGLAGIPGMPGIAGVPGRPGLAGRPGRSGRSASWASMVPF